MWRVILSREMRDDKAELEQLNASLNEAETLMQYRAPFDHTCISLLPRLFGSFLISCGNLVYGERPSYLKFRAIEVIARVPYHSWTSAIFTLFTLFYSDEARALKLSTLSRFAHLAADNETMHVVVVSALARMHERAGFFRHTLIPMLFAFLYFWVSYVLYLIYPRYALQINYLFENHAFEQYAEFLERCGSELAHRPIDSEFLSWYGRHPRSQFEFFRSVMNDELIHRNRSIREMELHCAR